MWPVGRKRLETPDIELQQAFSICVKSCYNNQT